MSTAPLNAPEAPCVVVMPDAAPGRLADLGLSADVLTDTVGQGDSRRKTKMAAQYPRNYPSIVAWAETLAELRRKLIRLQVGWESNNFANYETVYLIERSVSIAVAGGDKNTGTTGNGHPKLARKRGPMTTDRVRKNVNPRQFAFDLGPQFEPREKAKKKQPADLGCQTWFLVVFADKDEVRLELSLPSGIGKDGVVSTWLERIILLPLPVSGAVLPIDPYQDDDDHDDPLVTRN
jgi:hypothetical protein